MNRGHPQQDGRKHGVSDLVTAAQAALAARKEVVDILTEALWSLICAGRGPGTGFIAHRDNIDTQAVETTGD